MLSCARSISDGETCDHLGGPDEGDAVESSYAAIIADYLKSVAEWRRRRAAEEPHEPRHRKAAVFLDELAGFVAGVPEADERIIAIGRTTRQGEIIVPGPILANAVARFGFFEDDISMDALLTRMAELAIEDRGQAGIDPLRDLPF
jgi:hypothetical protein